MKYLIILVIVMLFDCSYSYRILMHPEQTKDTHYILIKRPLWPSFGETCYDCYSRPDSSKWEPTCKKINIK